jgi:NADPH:quinone reductase-like Zn-dependent oxidoreductase
MFRVVGERRLMSPRQGAAMKAIVQDRYGSVDVLRIQDIDVPVPGDDDVLVRVYAAGVDPSVWHFMTGLPYLARLGLGLRAPKLRVRGLDVAGRIEAAGGNVTGLQPGDAVFGTCDGSFAEYTLARPDKLAPMPANLNFGQAAAVPVSGCTALQALRDKAKVQPGQRVLIIGAGGGVGSFAVQLAKAFGAEVTGVCSTAKADLVRSLGADVVDYTREDFVDQPRRYDVIVDTAGLRSLAHLRRGLTPKGTLVIVGGEGGGRWLGGVDRLPRAALMTPLTGQRLLGLLATEPREDLDTLRELIEAGKLKPVIDRRYPLGEVPDAIRRLERGHARGKLVVTIRDSGAVE